MSLKDIVNANGDLIIGADRVANFWRQATCAHPQQIKDPEDPEGHAICTTCGAHIELDLDAILLRGLAAVMRSIGRSRP